MSALKRRVLGLARARKMKTRIFSGSPVLTRVSLSQKDGLPTWSLVFNNGLLLTLGEAGILDYQDHSFAQFMRGRDGTEEHDREALVTLHKIVLKSLLKYLVHPGLDPGQRERAAEAASKLWLAADEALEPADSRWMSMPSG
jgi:hypothetical protein